MDVTQSRDGKFIFVKNRLNGSSVNVALTDTPDVAKQKIKKLFSLL